MRLCQANRAVPESLLQNAHSKKRSTNVEVTPSGNPVSYPVAENRFPWGCLLGGCAGVVLLMVAGIGVVALSGYWFYKGQLTKYTSDTPKELPVVTLADEEIAEIEARIETFKQKVEAGEETDELVLTAEDINALVSKQKELRGRVFVRIQEGKVSADVSIPADQLPGGKGRYFNGSVTVRIELEGGVLIVTIDQAEVNGQPVPEAVMEGLRKENLAKETYKDPDSARQLARIEKIEIKDDLIVLKVRKSDERAAEASDGTDEPGANEPPAGNGSEAAETTDASQAEITELPESDASADETSTPDAVHSSGN